MIQLKEKSVIYKILRPYKTRVCSYEAYCMKEANIKEGENFLIGEIVYSTTIHKLG